MQLPICKKHGWWGITKLRAVFPIMDWCHVCRELMHGKKNTGFDLLGAQMQTRHPLWTLYITSIHRGWEKIAAKFIFLSENVWISINISLKPPINTLRQRQNGRQFPDDVFICIFLNENVWIAINFSLEFVPKVRINNIPALVQIMAWRRPGDKPLSESMRVSLLMHICVTRPQRVNNITSLFQIKAWHWPGDKALFEPMMASLLMHMCH